MNIRSDKTIAIQFKHFIFDFTELEVMKLFQICDQIVNGGKAEGIAHLDFLRKIMSHIRNESNFNFCVKRLELLEELAVLDGKLKR